MTGLTDIATRHAIHLERLKTHDARQFFSFLRKMERDIVAQLNTGDFESWNKATLNKRLTAIRDSMEGQFGDFDETWRQHLTDLSGYEANFEVKALTRVVRHDFDLPSSDQLRQAVFNNPLQIAGVDGGALLDEVYRDWTRTERKRVVNSIRMSYAQGETTPQAIRRIRGTKAAGFRDGALALTNRAMEDFVRTALQHSAVQAREEVWRRNKDIVKGVRWVSTLDGNTSDICRSLDTQVFPVDSGPRPPAHRGGCRSTTVAELDQRFFVLERDGTRAARLPQDERVVISVPSKEQYYSWLKKQNLRFIISVLGPTRAKLLLDGGLSVERFRELQLHKNFAPATLAQIKEWEPLAFERAGLN